MAKTEEPPKPPVVGKPEPKDQVMYAIYPGYTLTLAPNRKTTIVRTRENGDQYHVEEEKAGIQRQFVDGAALIPGEFVDSLKKKPMYKTQYVFQEDLEGHENEVWAQHFIRQMQKKREIMNLPPLRPVAVHMPQPVLPVPALA